MAAFVSAMILLLAQEFFHPLDDIGGLAHDIFDDFLQLFARYRIEIELAFIQLR